MITKATLFNLNTNDGVFPVANFLEFSKDNMVSPGAAIFRKKILLDKLSVRQTEELVKSLKKDKKIPNEIKKHLPKYIKNSLSDLNSYLGHKVNVTVNGKGKGKISIPFHSKEDFERIKNLLK